MSKRSFPLIVPKPIPLGTEAYEKKREAIVQELHESIPKDLWISQDVIDNPPLDVRDIPRTCGILTDEELEITESYDTVSLAEAIASKKYKAVTVAKAFAKRAAIAHQISCCLTQFFMDEALERAQYLDEYLEKNGKPIGPLHGVPISIKEHMPMAGHYSSWGYLSTRRKSEQDSLTVEILRNAGAVFYVKTNQPQGIMHLESDGFHGRTLNPANINLSSGGSTGGEAALIALNGSVMGVGTDIGGSVRGPCAFSGIHGFKPTCYTLTMKDFLPDGFAAELNILCSTGPMCRSLRDMDFYMNILISSKMYLHDPRVIPFPWTGLKTPLPNKPLKIGLMLNDGNIIPQPPVLRALGWAKSKLSEHSDLFSVKPYHPYNAAEAISLIRRYYWPDGALTHRHAMEETGEPVFPLTEISMADGSSDRECTASEVLAQRLTRDQFRCDFAEHWNAQDVDFVLCPVFVGPASAHDTAKYWNYTALWNFLDYPGAVIPTGLSVGAGEKGKGYAEDYEPLSTQCADVKKMWEKTDFVGAPICLQVVARRYHDNELFGALGVLQKALGFA